MKLKINKVHIRYEDDYLNVDAPFSFGIVIDVKISFYLCLLIETNMGVN